MTDPTSDSTGEEMNHDDPNLDRRSGPFKRFGNFMVRVFMPVEADALAKQSWLERRMQSAMLTIMTSAVVWGVVTLTGVDKSQAEMNVKLQNIEVQISGMYPAKDARRDLEITGLKIDALGQRIDVLDGRVRDFEQRRGIPPQPPLVDPQ